MNYLTLVAEEVFEVEGVGFAGEWGEVFAVGEAVEEFGLETEGSVIVDKAVFGRADKCQGALEGGRVEVGEAGELSQAEAAQPLFECVLRGGECVQVAFEEVAGGFEGLGKRHAAEAAVAGEAADEAVGCRGEPSGLTLVGDARRGREGCGEFGFVNAEVAANPGFECVGAAGCGNGADGGGGVGEAIEGVVASESFEPQMAVQGGGGDSDAFEPRLGFALDGPAVGRGDVAPPMCGRALHQSHKQATCALGFVDIGVVEARAVRDAVGGGEVCLYGFIHFRSSEILPESRLLS